MAYESMNTKYAKAKIVIGAYEFNSDEYRIDSIAITTGSYDGSVVGVGNTYTAMCTITMQDIEEVVLGTALSVYFEINGTFQKFGKFWVNSQPIINGDVMTLNCHGALGQQGNSAFWYPGMYYTNEVTTIGNLLTGITEVSEMSTLEFDTDADLTDFLNKPITVPVKESFFSPNTELNYSNNHGISKQEFLAGIAILFGGNVSERNGILYFIPKTPDASRERAIFAPESYADHRLSRESYGINTIAIDYMPTRYGGYFDQDPSVAKWECQFYSGNERKRRLMLASQTSGLGANVTYDQVVECDWIGYSAETEGMYCTMQSDLKYRAGEYTFVGYNENLYAGNIVDIEHDNGETVSFYIGEMTLEWDGGFTTTVSCNCDVDVSTGTYNSSTSSTVTANKVSSSAQNAENKIAFADITFSNVKDSTISGSKFIDGTITGSKIADSTIKNSNIKNGTIEGSKIADATITGSNIVDGTIDGSKIKNASITGAEIDGSTFTDGQIKGSAIDTSSFANGSISGSAINASTFTDGQISGTAIDTSTFKDGTISGSVIESSTLKDIPYASMDAAFIGDLTSDSLFSDIIGAKVIEVGALTADEADLRYADIKLAKIDVADVGTLFADVGLLDRATIVDGHVTGFLDAVQVNANMITSGTLVTDRLVIRGNDKSIVYAINSMQSKNLLQDTATSQTKGGVTFTVNDDGSVTCNGKATEELNLILSTAPKFEDGTYILSGCPSGGSKTTFWLDYANWVNLSYQDFGDAKEFTPFDVEKYPNAKIRIVITNGYTANNLTFYPMIRKAEISEKNLLQNTAVSKTLNGVTYTINKDGSVLCNGTATNWASLTINTMTLPAGTYELTGGGIGTNIVPYMAVRIVSTNELIADIYKTKFSISEDTKIHVTLTTAPNVTVTNYVAYPMIRKAEITDDTYEPYILNYDVEYEPYRVPLQELNSETINGENLTPRTINADRIIAGSITANEVDVDKLFADEVVAKAIAAYSGEFVELDAGQIKTGYLSASRIKAASIDATKLNVKDLNAIGATIGGFNIASNSIYREYETTSGSNTYMRKLMINSDVGNSDNIQLSNFINGVENARLSIGTGNDPTAINITGYGGASDFYPMIGITDNLLYSAACIDMNGTVSSTLTPYDGSMNGFYYWGGTLNSDGKTITNAHFDINVPLNLGSNIHCKHNIEYTMYGYTGTPLEIWGGNENGCALTLGMGAAVIVGAGESGRALESIITGTSEQLHLAADQAINFYSNCNNIEDRKHVVLDQSSNFYPDTTDTTGYGSIGKSGSQWASGYIYNMYAHTLYENGYPLRNTYAVVSNGVRTVSGNGAWQVLTITFGNTYEKPPLVSILPTTQFASENIRFVSFTGNSTNGYTGMTIEVYTATSGFTYSVRWMAIGNLKI